MIDEYDYTRGPEGTEDGHFGEPAHFTLRTLCLECLHDRHWRREVERCECLNCLRDVDRGD